MKVKRVLLITSLSSFLCFSQAYANSETQVPKRVVKDTIAYCNELEIIHREVGETAEEYLLKCVNEELKSNGFATINTLD